MILQCIDTDVIWTKHNHIWHLMKLSSYLRHMSVQICYINILLQSPDVTLAFDEISKSYLRHMWILVCSDLWCKYSHLKGRSGLCLCCDFEHIWYISWSSCSYYMYPWCHLIFCVCDRGATRWRWYNFYNLITYYCQYIVSALRSWILPNLQKRLKIIFSN